VAKIQILCWEEIPSVVEAKESRTVHKEPLSARFQELIDWVAMRKKLAGTDAYLEQWNKTPAEERPGSAKEVATAVAAEIEARYEQIRADALSRCR
jgi:CTP synthase (UTP-ammonia lyase)